MLRQFGVGQVGSGMVVGQVSAGVILVNVMSSIPDRDTIFALSSGKPPAAIAVVRISGPQAARAVEQLTGRIPKPRQATLLGLRDPVRDEILDQALVLWMPGPASETGEDVAELQMHGGRAVVAAVLRTLSAMAGLRAAEAGEFTRRAFENGRLDLTEVEGLADLIAAETDAQRRQAFRQLSGVLGSKAEDWRRRVIEALALAEAAIDFAEEEADVPGNLSEQAHERAQLLLEDVEVVLRADRRSERLREGLVVAIAGPPNAGKSSLLNRIARRDAAIVSPFAGTTRDVIEVHLDLNGYPVTLLDTAGIRDTGDPVEQIGIRRARERSQAADLVLWVVDALDLRSETEGASAKHAREITAPPHWLVINKVDLIDSAAQHSQADRFGSESFVFHLSALSGRGLDGLLTSLEHHAEAHFGEAESGLISRERHRQALEATRDALRRAVEGEERHKEEVLAEELRQAARNLGRLTGRVDVDDVLDVIFRDFCIGK